MTVRTNRIMSLLIVVFVLLTAAPTFAGNIIYVDDDGPADFNNIQAAINDSNNGDTIIVADGIYTGPGNRDIDFGGRAINVRSENGPNNCIIDCEGTSSDNHRGFYFHSGENANSILDGLTVTHGYVENFGGAIYCREASPTVSNCTITSNWVQWGLGGGIYSFNSSLKISHCTIMGNSAPWGGGITCQGNGNPIISYCTIRGNSAPGPEPYLLPRGGGICASTSGLKISYCKISGNSTVGWGGGIYFDDNCTISHCTVTGNSPQGIYCELSSPNINCCVITGNKLSGIYCNFSSPKIINCTISGNNFDGIGIAYALSSPIVTNCILWDDWPSEISVFSATVSVTYCDVEGGWPGIGNINADPCFADVNNGDYHLKSQAGRWEPDLSDWVIDTVTSPAIDAGDTADPIGFEPFPNGGVINIGAYGGTTEASKSYFGSPPCETIVAGDVNGDCVVNFLDFCLMALHWLEDNSTPPPPP